MNIEKEWLVRSQEKLYELQSHIERMFWYGIGLAVSSLIFGLLLGWFLKGYAGCHCI